MSHSILPLLALAPTFQPTCPYLSHCTRTLLAEGCSACRFNSGRFGADGDQPEPDAGLHLVAIPIAEAAC